MSSSEVVSSIFFPRNELLWMEKLTVSTSTNFVDNGRLEINEDSPRDMLPSTSLAKESIERIVCNTNCSITATTQKTRISKIFRSTKQSTKSELGFIPRHHSVRLDSMFETVKLPTRISDLDPSLSDVNAYDFSHLLSVETLISSDSLLRRTEN